MKNKPLFDRTVSVLVKAYHNDTLNPTNACGCGVGNIVGAANGYDIIKGHRIYWLEKNGSETFNPHWTKLFISGMWKNPQDQKGLKEIEPTGYTARELYDIEQAFMTPNYIMEGEDDIFKRLMNTLDTLMEIHQATPQEIETAKQLF